MRSFVENPKYNKIRRTGNLVNIFATLESLIGIAMNETKVNTFFVSEKISKIRWVPEALIESERFLTGSWDSSKNFVKIWRLIRNQYEDDYNEYVPKFCDKVSFVGDINGIEFLTEDVVAVCCADGYVKLIQVQLAVEEDILQQKGDTALLHYFNSGKAAPCTSLSVYAKDIASVGEDGRLNIINAGTLKVIKAVQADSCALTAVTYVNPKEILTANRMGVIRMFDTHSGNDAVGSFMVSCEDEKKSNYVSCLTYHPTQKHIIFAGSEEGSLTIWDLRQPGFPASYISAHSTAITEIGFHRSEPGKLFTAAEGGELWQWTQNTLSMSNSIESQITRGNSTETDSMNIWLNGERAKSRISVTALISEVRKSINSFDASGSKIICGGDSEAIYFIDNII